MVRGRDGFTLLELLVVLVIIAMMVMIAVPSLTSGVPQTQLRGGAREVAAALKEARSRAILSNRDVEFRLDVNGHYFAVTGDRQRHQLPPKIELSLFTARQELRGNGVGSIRFFPDGSSTGGSVKLSFGKSSYRVTVNWLTGNIEIVG